MRPALGARLPLTISNKVDLPAPLGPISPTTSPARTANETSRSATTPPKLRQMPFTSSAGAFTGGLPQPRS